MSFQMCFKLLLPIFHLMSFAVAQLVVNLPNGKIRGQELISFTNKSYLAFQGIPFARPPVGDLRFQAPQPPSNWDGVKETTELKYCCYSMVTDFDRENEDCLHLNVFTPLLNADINTTKLPVVFWIYGGGFNHGCADWWPQYWMDEDIIVVAANYRVGPFGFLATGDIVAPGNAGLKDQNLALKWTNTNIHLFGGDKSRITIAGQSAGGASVGWQVLSTKSKGLFRAAVMESGSPLNTWSFLDQPLEYAFDLAQTINSSISSNASSNQLVKFLQSVNPTIIDVFSTKTKISQPNPGIEPSHPDAFLTQPMYELFSSGNFTQVPMIIGINSEERITMAADMVSLKLGAQNADQTLYELIPENFNYKPNVNTTQIGEQIRQVYTGNATFAERLGKWVRFGSDDKFTRGVIKQAQLMAKFNTVYFYQFSYDGVAGGINVTIADAEKVGHVEELRYSWSMVPLDQLDSEDRLTHFRMIKMWTNFVKDLNPTPISEDLLNNIDWPKFTEEKNFQFLNINNTLSIESNPKDLYFYGWESIFNKYAQRPYKTF